METKMAVFAARLKVLRKERKITQREMAQLLDITERHYQAVEAGTVNIPSLTLAFLADHFSVSVDYLLGRTDNPEINR